MGADWLVYAGENEGLPLIVMLDRSHGRGHFDRSRPWAILVEISLARVDGNALPAPEDWPALEAIEAALVRELATDDDDWQYVVRIYGEATCRFGFYARRSAAAAARVQRVMNEFSEGEWAAKVTVQSDPKWSAYDAFFPADDAATPRPGHPEHPTIAPSFRDDPITGPSPSFRRGPYRPRDEQPWRGDESQAHPED